MTMIHRFEGIERFNYNMKDVPLEEIRNFLNIFYKEEAGQIFMHNLLDVESQKKFDKNEFMNWQRKREERIDQLLKKMPHKIKTSWYPDLLISNIDIFYLSLIHIDIPLIKIIEKIVGSAELKEWEDLFEKNKNKGIKYFLNHDFQACYLAIHWLEQTKTRKMDDMFLSKKKEYEEKLVKRIRSSIHAEKEEIKRREHYEKMKKEYQSAK